MPPETSLQAPLGRLSAELGNGARRRLRVLVIAAACPVPTRSGRDTRNLQLLRQIARRHDTTLLTYERAGSEGELAALADELSIRVVPGGPPSGTAKRSQQLRSLLSLTPFSCTTTYSDAMQRAIDELNAEHHFDLIHVESVTACSFRFPAGIPICLDEHNVEYELHKRLWRGESSLVRRLFSGWEYLRMQRFEPRVWKRAGGCVVTSERELPTVRAAAPQVPTAVVPNGVDLEYFARSGATATPHSVVFCGVLNYRPNVDAASFLVEQVWPQVMARYPDAQLTLVGTAPEEERIRLTREGVEVLGEVPDVRPHICGSAVVAVSVRIGGGTRLKVLEAMALGRPIVSTSLGCEGIAVRDGEQLLIGDDAETFAARILELFEDPDRGTQLADAGRELVESSYSWDLAGQRLEDLYRQIRLARVG